MSPVPARRGLRHRRRRRDRPRPRPLRALHHDRMRKVQQLHHRPDLQERAREGAPRRLPRQDGAGDPARHQRDPGVRQARRRYRRADHAVDVAIVEIGGTVGDIESLPFLEAVRPDEPEAGARTNSRLRAPDLRALDRRRRRAEDQADPAHGAEAARDRHPADALLCRADRPIPDEEREKISLFTNVPEWGVISMWDVDTIYKVPRMLHEQGLGRPDLRQAAPAHHRRPNLKRWDDLVYEVEHPQTEVRIAMVGKYTDLSDSYKSLNEALRHAGIHNHAKVADRVRRLRDDLPRHGVGPAGPFDAILVPGGFGKRGIEGKIVRRPPSRARTRCPTSASAWACRSPRSSSRATWPAWRAPTAPSSSPDAAPGDRADRPSGRTATAASRSATTPLRPRRHDAPGRAELRRQVDRHAGPRDLRQRGHRAAPPPLRGQRQLPRQACSEGRPRHLCPDAARAADRDRRAATRAVHPWFMGVQFHPSSSRSSQPWARHTR